MRLFLRLDGKENPTPVDEKSNILDSIIRQSGGTKNTLRTF
jgi:hypothetical protein